MYNKNDIKNLFIYFISMIENILIFDKVFILTFDVLYNRMFNIVLKMYLERKVLRRKIDHL